MSISQKAIYSLNTIPIITKILFSDPENDSEIHSEHKSFQIAKTVLNNKNKARGLIPDFKIHYRNLK